MVRAILPWVLLAAATGGVLWLTIAQRELAREAGQQEVALRAAEGRLQGLVPRSELEALTRDNAELRGRIIQLETELQQVIEHANGLSEMVTQRAADEAARRLAQQEALRRANAPIPEGVRLCLATLQECLRADGYDGVRFLGARELAEHELRRVELIDADADSLGTTLYLADRMTIEVDRGRGTARLRFYGGHRLQGGVQTPFPDEGFDLLLEAVTPRLWEERLPFLVRAVGAHPEAPDPAMAKADAVDTQTRLLWIDRLNGLLAMSTADTRLKVKIFRGMRDGRFLEVTLAGYDDAGLLRFGATAREMSVEVDQRAGIVQLMLLDGTLHGSGGQSTISPDGYRILLSDVQPQQASDTMLGMVVKK